MIIGLTPPLALLLTWLVFLPFAAARAGLDLVNADDGLDVRISPQAIMLVVFGLCVTRVAWLNARSKRAPTISSSTTTRPLALGLLGVVGCTGLMLAGAGSVWIEAGGAEDLSEVLQRALVIGGFLAWAVPITGVTVIAGVWFAGMIVRAMQWDGFVWTLGIAFVVLPSGLVTVMLVAPHEFEHNDGVSAIAAVADATDGLLELAASQDSLADAGGFSRDGGHGGDPPARVVARYEILECLEELSSPPMPGTSSIHLSARCGNPKQRSPIEDVWCDLKLTEDRWHLEHALADAVVKTCEQKPRRGDNLAGYLRTTTKNELRQERRRSGSRHRNAPIYYDRAVRDDVDLELDRERCKDALQHALEELDPKDRSLLLDKYELDKSWRDIAKERGMTESAVKKRGERIRNLLRNAIGRVCQ